MVTAAPGSQEAWVLLPDLLLDLGQVSSLDLSRFLPAFLPLSPTLGYRENESPLVLRKWSITGDRRALLTAQSTKCRDERHTKCLGNARHFGVVGETLHRDGL